ncbi:MAG TPA: hypothetical protein V6D19_13065 [Stenomitos sp.]
MSNLPYELAKKLKDAGFPQRDTNNFHTCFYWCTKVQEPGFKSLDSEPYVIYGSQGWVDSVLVRNPTLEELILACGENFNRLNLYANGGWYAKGWIGMDRGIKGIRTEFCPTPLIAVANLWLELNKKQ